MIKKCLEKEERVQWLFLALKKAFDSVNCDAAWKLFGKIGMPGGFVDLLRGLHECMQAKVRVENNMSNSFEISNRFRKGCVFAPYGFIMHTVMSPSLTRSQNIY